MLAIERVGFNDSSAKADRFPRRRQAGDRLLDAGKTSAATPSLAGSAPPA
jgi:hypothetical protein